MNPTESSARLESAKQRQYDMNGIFQMQGGKNWILPKKITANRFFWDSHCWKSGQTTFVPLWDLMEGAWLRTQEEFSRSKNLDRECTNSKYDTSDLVVDLTISVSLSSPL